MQIIPHFQPGNPLHIIKTLVEGDTVYASCPWHVGIGICAIISPRKASGRRATIIIPQDLKRQVMQADDLSEVDRYLEKNKLAA